jgi:putative ABC transport system substrate-binding protein
MVGALMIPDLPLSAFREELKDRGYIDGSTIQFEIRSAKGDIPRLPALAAELVGAKADVIVAWYTPAVLAASGATSEIPIVMAGVGDPVGSKLVASLAHPGGNITGIGILVDLLTEKNVELLKGALPNLSRIAALCNAPDPFSKVFLDHIRHACDALKIEVVPFMVSGGAELDTAFPAMAEGKVQAVLVQPTLPLGRAAELAMKYRLPAMAPAPGFATSGGLMSYSANPDSLDRAAAVFVDKILKGAKPAALPVEQPTKFELVINLKTARAIGLSVPAMLVAQADDVIE